MSLTKALKRIFVGAPSDEEPRMPDGSPEPMTRQEFEDQIVDHFRYRLRKETTKGSLVYPTNFYIYLTPTDYEEQKEAFPFTVLDVVNEFNAIIGDKRKEYPSFTPIAKYWQFQFLRFEEGTMIENMRETVSGMEDGSVLVMSYIFTKENLDVVPQENVRVVTTKRNKGTVKTHQLSINTDALRGLMMESETLYKVPAGNFSKVGIDSVSKDGPKPIARLKIAPYSDSVCFLTGGQNAEVCNMLMDTLQVCGKNGVETTGFQTLKVSSDAVLNPHFRIEKTPQGFRITALGSLVLNEVPMEKGESAPLPSNSAILLNNMIQITFKTV